MGHAHHFLSRLDRVSQDHVELALSLYNDPALLRHIMQEAGVCAGSERVALSLDHPVEGPFVVVTRDGRFVTCLGAGMRVDLPVITRPCLDGVIERVATMRERRDMAARLCPDERASGKLMRRVFNAGENLSREEFLALSAMQPMLVKSLVAMLAPTRDLLRSCQSFFREISVGACSAEDLDDAERAALHVWWDANWGLKHTLLLLGLDGDAARLAQLLGGGLGDVRHAFTHDAMLNGLFAPAAAGAWCTARFGDALVPLCHAGFHAASTRAEVLENAMGLFAVAGRSSFHRRAAHRALLPGAAPAANDGPARAVHLLKRDCERAFGHAFARDVDRLEVDAAVAGATRFLAQRTATAHWNGWRSLSDVPVDLARVALVDDLRCVLDEKSDVADALRHLPAIARMRAQDFYLPEAILQRVREPWSLHRTLVAAARVTPRDAAPARPVYSAGRNEPCPCRSGRKFKKCCAVTPATPRRSAA